jgi:hypothetical protein
MATASALANVIIRLQTRATGMATAKVLSSAPLVLFARGMGMATAKQTINTAAQAIVNLAAIGISMATNRGAAGSISPVLKPFRREYYRPAFSSTNLEGGFIQSREFT